MAISAISSLITGSTGLACGFLVQESLMRQAADKQLGGKGSEGQKIRSLVAPLAASVLIATISSVVEGIFGPSFLSGLVTGVLVSVALRNQAAWSARQGEALSDLGCARTAKRPVIIGETQTTVYIERPRMYGYATEIFPLVTGGLMGCLPGLPSYLAPFPTATITALIARFLDESEEKTVATLFQQQSFTEGT